MFASKFQVNEKRAIGEVKDRLRTRYAGRSPAEVSLVVDQATERFTTARVRDFSPLRGEHISRDELSRRLAAR